MNKKQLLWTCVGLALLGSLAWFIASDSHPPKGSLVQHSRNVLHDPETERAASAGAAELRGEWQKTIEEVLGAGEDPSSTCRKLISLVKKTPPAAQVELAQHILNLASGDDFLEVLPLMKDRTVGVKFHRRIALGLLNQREDIKLRGVLDIASSDWHPMTQQFRTLLPSLTGEDAGEDWGKWREIVEEQIAAERKAVQGGIPAKPETSGNPGPSQ
jgi:hypothetical protein